MADLDALQATGTPAPGHEQCPHCRDALIALQAIEDLVRGAYEQEEREQRRAVSLTDRIMRTVRTELRPGPLVPMGEPDEDLWITHAAAARAVRRAVDALPGIKAGRCRINPLSDPEYRHPRTGRLPRGPVRVRLEIAISLGNVVAEAAAAARGAVTGVADDCGLDVHEIEIAVVDLIVTGLPGGGEGWRGDGR